MKYINHITLNTGHNYQSPESEMAFLSYRKMGDWLATVKNGELTQLPVSDLNCQIRMFFEHKGFIAILYRNDTPLVTIGVSTHSLSSDEIWDDLHNYELPLKTNDSPPPSAPWCAARIEPGAITALDVMHWIGDFERCLAWTFIRANKKQ